MGDGLAVRVHSGEVKGEYLDDVGIFTRGN